MKQRIKIVTNRAGLIETIILCPVSEDEERTKASAPDKPRALGAFQRKPGVPKAEGK